MKCINCEKEISEGSKFCPYCGYEIASKEEISKSVEQQDNIVADLKNQTKTVELLNKSYTYEHIIYAVFALIILIASFLPYYSVSMFGASSSIRILDVELGYIVPGLAIGCLIMFLAKSEFMMMWIGLVELVLSLLIYVGVSENAKEIGIGGFSVGCYLILICAVFLGILGSHLAIKFKKPKSERSAFVNSTILRFKIILVLIVVVIIAFIIESIFSL